MKTLRLVLLLAVSVPLTSTAFAQSETADGVGRSDRAVDAEEIADNIESLSDYEEKFYSISVRSWAIVTPAFLLDAFFDRHTNHWQGGRHNFAHGLEFTTRIPDKYDLVASIDWADLRTPDGFWVEDGDPVRDASWSESTLSMISLDVSFHWLQDLGPRQDWQVYGGVGIGAGFLLGKFLKTDVDTQACGMTEAERASTDVSLLNRCFDANGDPQIIGPQEEEDQVPPVLPAISGTLGFRYLIDDRFSVALEGGLKSIFFYGGLEFGYFWGADPT